MTDTPSTAMTDKTLARLRAYGKGNNVKDAEINVIETKEQTYTISGQLTLTPHCEITVSTAVGRMKGKGKAYKVLSSFEELRTEIETVKNKFQQEGDWKPDAIKDLETTEGHGWGLHGSFMTWSDKKSILGATEKCPTCKGAAQHPCPECRGLGSLPCHHCESRGQELCYQCNGSKMDPYNPNNKCPTCSGTGWALCRFCQGQMKMPCVRCHGRGQLSCDSCNGSGSINREAEIAKGAKMDFTLGATSGLPSGLLRGLSRLGEDKLCKGHADISMRPLLDEDPNADKSGPLIVKLEAKIPFAEIKIRIRDKGYIISCFGKQGRLSGIPAFLDEALSEARDHLRKAVKGEEPLEMCMDVRLIKEAFLLVLAGKTHTNDLRRLYPVGLSAETAQEIMKALSTVFRNSTARTRQIVGGVCVAASSLLVLILSLSPVFAHIGHAYGKPVLFAGYLALLGLCLGGSWQALRYGAKTALSKQFKGSQASAPQVIGKTGQATLAAVAILFFAILFITGNLP